MKLSRRKLCTFGGCQSVALPDSSRCEKHSVTYTPKRRYEHHYHEGKHIYTSARWIALRCRLLALNPMCCECERVGLVTPAVLVDHIREIKDDGDIWNEDNLQCLCNACHNRKTARAAMTRRRGKGNKLSDF